jgi:hypothetical protein
MRARGVGLLLLFGCMAGAMLSRFPPMNGDEVNNVVVSRNFVQQGRGRYSINDDIYPRDVYFFRDICPTEFRPIYELWLGPTSASNSHSVFIYRWPSLFAGLLALLALMGIGASLKNTALGVGCMAVALAHPAFWLGGSIVNELILLCGWSCGILLWECRAPLRQPWSRLVTGGLIGAGVLIHPNSLLFFGGMVMFVGIREQRQRNAAITSLCVGLIAGLLLAVSAINLTRFTIYQKSFFGHFIKPPLLTWPWAPWDWFWATLRSWLYPVSYYLYQDSLWRCGIELFWVGAFLLGITYAWRTTRKKSPNKITPDKPILACAGGLAGVFLAMLLLQPRNEALYVLIALPFLAPLIGMAWSRLRQDDSKSSRAWRLLLAGCFVLSAGAYTANVLRFAPQNRSYQAVVADVHRLIPASAQKVVGPTILWWGFKNFDFRDVGAMVTARYITSESADLKKWLAPWRPDILVADRRFCRIFLNGQSSPDVLAARLGTPARVLGTVMSQASDDPWIIFSMDWKGSR